MEKYGIRYATLAVSEDDIDTDTRFGCIAYGFKTNNILIKQRGDKLNKLKE